MINYLEGRFRYFTQKELENGRIIPEELYVNIIPTGKVLNALREWYGKPIYINSTYRDSDYNKAIGGGRYSLHLEFNAIDFTVKERKDLKLLHKQLLKWDDEYKFSFLPKKGSMGIGLYSTFIHLDTRAILGRKSPTRWSG